MSDAISEDNPERQLHLAQLERARMENEKLALELAELRKGKPWYTPLIQIIPILSTLIAIVGFGWGVIQYSEQQTQNRLAAENALMKPWLESQRQYYTQALAVAAKFANTDDPIARKKAAEEFLQLENGNMILVETTDVSKIMGTFRHCVNGDFVCDRDKMNEICLALGTAMANSMAATAKMTYREFAAKQFKYDLAP